MVSGIDINPAGTAAGDIPSCRQLLERLPAGAYTCDAAGLITYFNPRAVELWGREPRLNCASDRYCGSFRLFAPDGAPIRHDQCWMALALRNASEYNGQEIVIERPDGGRRTALAHANPVINGEGKVVAAVNVLMDITDHRRREEEWRQLQTTLTHMGRLTLAGEMAAGLAHELNQPLTAIINYGEAGLSMLRKEPQASAALLDVLGQIVEQGQHAGEIIRRLGGFTRHQTPRRQEHDLNRLIAEAIQFTAMDRREHRVSTELITDPQIPPVSVDGVQLQQVLLNLIRNGIDAVSGNAPGNRQLIIHATRDAVAGVIVSVQDNGRGLDGTVREQLFQPFVTTKQQGMGLGLPISSSIVEAHGGRLWLEHSDSSGTCFRFSLPSVGRH